MIKFSDEECMKAEDLNMAAPNNTFVEKHFDFPVPKEIEIAINNIKKAVVSNSTLLDCYLEEFRAIVHWNTGGENGLTEKQGEELIDYYYRRRYTNND